MVKSLSVLKGRNDCNYKVFSQKKKKTFFV